jgi:hypothetical protein
MTLPLSDTLSPGNVTFNAWGTTLNVQCAMPGSVGALPPDEEDMKGEKAR